MQPPRPRRYTRKKRCFSTPPLICSNRSQMFAPLYPISPPECSPWISLFRPAVRALFPLSAPRNEIYLVRALVLNVTPQTDHCPPSVLAHLPALIEHAGGGSAMQSTTRGWAEWDATAPQHLQARAHPSPHMLSEIEHSRTVVCKATETSMREG